MQKSNSPFLGIRPDLSEVSSFMLGSGLSVAFHALPTARKFAFLISAFLANSASFLSIPLQKSKIKYEFLPTLSCFRSSAGP